MNRWIFGYGSLIWRPNIEYLERHPARLAGWQRRFWQGSHDHRGVPSCPGRVVTLAPEAGVYCDGIAYLLDQGVVEETFQDLDVREKNGYERHNVSMQLLDASICKKGLVYIAPVGNHAFLGPASLPDMVQQILQCVGPSGTNVDYLLQLAAALRQLNAIDPHVFELEAAVLQELK
jgi:cation transport regulator ChaC